MKVQVTEEERREIADTIWWFMMVLWLVLAFAVGGLTWGLWVAGGGG
jgi:hypothetical protein